MASASRTFSRLSCAAPLNTSRPASRIVPRQTFRQTFRRGYAEGPKTSPQEPLKSAAPGGNSNTSLVVLLGLAAAAGGAGYFYYSKNPQPVENAGRKAASKIGADFKPKYEDYQAVYNEIAHHLVEHNEYDDGSYGPVLVRLGWHASGTYDKLTNTGGSNGATMRFAPESDHGANAGLKAARDFLEPIHGAVAAIQEMHGPTVSWRPGRSDRDAAWCTPDGRLPDGAKEHDHLRDIFYRMGFSDQEIVALSGAHALGRCHPDRSGFDGPWTHSPTMVTNDYYKLLLNEKWSFRKWDGPKQFEDVSSKSLMMLPADMALIKDKAFRPWVEKYAKDHDKFFSDFSNVLTKLFELGVPFKTGENDRMSFKPSH